MAVSPASSQSTRDALIRTALARFGEKGYEATSTREIAAGAKANIGSIAYHFGGKAGLRRACADYIVGTLRTAIVARVAGEPIDENTTPEAARARLLEGIETFIAFLTSRNEVEAIVRFMLREMTDPSAALDLIYSDIIGPTHRHLCRLWAVATGTKEESHETMLTVFAMMGQALYFRIAGEVVLRRMTWDKVGPAETREIAEMLKSNLSAVLDHQTNRNRKPPS